MPNVYLKDGRPQEEQKDCGVIALAYACDIDYKVAHAICKKAGRKDGHGMDARSIFKKKGKYLGHKEFSKFTIDGKEFLVTCYGRPGMTVKRFCETFKAGTYYVRVGGHICTVKDGIALNQNNLRQKVSFYFKIVKI